MVDNNNSGFKGEQSDQEVAGSKNNVEPVFLSHLSMWYKALLICFIVFPFSFLLGPFAAIAGFSLLIVLVITFFLGIRSLIRIKRSDGLLSDNGYTVPSIIVPVIIAISVVLTMSTIGQTIGHKIFYRSIHGVFKA